MPAGGRTAVLVIRAWLEEGFGDRALRARITRTSAGDEGTAETVAATEEDVLATVREWLRDLVAAEP
ncbi:MAG TPA: hypothetical protein VFB42_13130 [Gaiellaceae bacterium]|nr:hypothetical protein [Gaiellaceae bacterium]